MDLFKLTWVGLMLLYTPVAFSQNSNQFKSISLNNLDAFREPGNNWVIGGDAYADYQKPDDMHVVKGEGVLINTLSKNNRMNLFTKDEFGDLELDLDFMMAKNSNSGIYIQGRYEVQLLDSWTKLTTGYYDLGGIYTRSSKERGNFEGTPPLVNAAKAPGLWQHMKIKFRAPVFNANGQKISNAVFDEVFVNGVLVQQNTQVTGPTGSGTGLANENAKGPVVFQGDHGPVAFKNIRYMELVSEDTTAEKKSENWSAVNPIIVNPQSKPTFIKTFLNYGDKKLTHVISVGNPDQLHYSYDLKEGALFQVWRGEFLDLTQAWFDRGENQLGIPLGDVLLLSDGPVVTVLADDNAAWPDSVSFDEMNNKGYILDMQRSPTFSYSVHGLDISDSILNKPDGQALERTLTIRNAPANAYCRLAAGNKIENISGDLYAVNGKSYYIKVDSKFKPVIRQSAQGQELIVKYQTAGPVTYSIIW